jgi:hypothetical protein
MGNEMSIEDRIKMTRAIMIMFDELHIDPTAQVNLLGMPDDVKPRVMDRYRKGTPFPDDEQIMRRIEHLVAIYDALRTSFPRNAKMGHHWLTSPNRHFNYHTPLQVMLTDGMGGLETVRGRLDCTMGWI